MTKVNLKLQMKFLDQLEEALAEATERYCDAGDAKLSELTYMQREVDRARRIVSNRMAQEEIIKHRGSSKDQGAELLQQAHA